MIVQIMAGTIGWVATRAILLAVRRRRRARMLAAMIHGLIQAEWPRWSERDGL